MEFLLGQHPVRRKEGTMNGMNGEGFPLVCLKTGYSFECHSYNFFITTQRTGIHSIVTKRSRDTIKALYWQMWDLVRIYWFEKMFTSEPSCFDENRIFGHFGLNQNTWISNSRQIYNSMNVISRSLVIYVIIIKINKIL